ncbi:MAG TPA: site-specific DNA-methyltransferase [Polyangiaceae bacterium]|jgi:site-specific DNA-methyltransferase (adenine-specific)|nr:site-specific DNA-methyltransferase [Polyangiaceae bacterium]
MSASVRIGLGELVHGDCLQVLSELRAHGAFDLAYMDPPFNAGGERGARQKKGERVAGKLAYRDAWGGIDAFLAMLEPRLEIVRDTLSDQGSLWLHLDHRAVHDAKVLADRVFGRGAFQGEIIWVPGNGGKRRSGPSVTHQTLLVFARGKSMIWNGDDPALRERHAATSLRMHFKNVDASGRNYRDRVVGGKTYRYYADEGRRLGSVWLDCPSMRANTPLIREATGYPTQKPETLLERILRASTLPDSRVLDPMCGSGTTLVVAERLGRAWLGIDRGEIAFKTAKSRLGALIAKRAS